MEKRNKYKILQNSKIAKDVFKMILEGNTSAITNCGQFINIQLDELYLRRPISICDYDEKTITIIYKVVGEGTEKMSLLPEGKELDVLTGLGNGFNTNCSGERPLVVGGGVGTPPLYRLCKDLISAGKKPVVVLGFASKDDVFYEQEFKDLGVETYIATVDGSYGTKGFVTDVISQLNNYTYFYACGPMPMLKALTNALTIEGQLSLEERMGCGFGACMGCTIKTKNGFKRVCKEGPVFRREELIWED
jgi:dihydroorotate dehydrogenase electron transfer subunit